MDTSGPSQRTRSAAQRLAETGEDPRSQELAENLASVHERIDRAMEAAGRTDRPTLIVVTKFFPAADVARLYRLGVRDVGENRDQEAAAKATEVRALLSAEDSAAPAESTAAGADLHWHFIGQLQSNKAKSVVGYADHLHSVDRASLVKALKKTAEARSAAVVTCLIQVDLRDPLPTDGRGGAAPEDISTLADALEAAPGFRLGGLMAVAPLEEPPAPAFARLQELSLRLRARRPEADMISAGMSGDLEAAVAHGATHLRVGRDVLGERPLQR